MFDKVVGDLSGKVLSFLKDADKPKVSNSTARHQTSEWEGTISFFFLSLLFFFFFLLTLPQLGSVWPHPKTPVSPDSIQLWFKHSCWTGAAGRDPKSHSHRLCLRQLQGLTATAKATSLCLKSLPSNRGLCVLSAHAVYFVQSTDVPATFGLEQIPYSQSRSTTLTLKSSKPPSSEFGVHDLPLNVVWSHSESSFLRTTCRANTPLDYFNGALTKTCGNKQLRSFLDGKSGQLVSNELLHQLRPHVVLFTS